MERSRRWWLTPCGLDCSTCTIHLRTDEELEYWHSQKVDVDKVRCDGCRSDRDGPHWSPDCTILECCVHKRGLEFCSQCSDFPCAMLEKWGSEYEHHTKALENLREMKKQGVEDWLKSHDLH
jgi:hypothetical protein